MIAYIIRKKKFGGRLFMGKEFDSVTEMMLAAASSAAAQFGRGVTFESLGDDDGVALFPGAGDDDVSEERDILGGGVRRRRRSYRLVWRCASVSESGRLYADDALRRIGVALADAFADGALPLRGGGRIVRITRGSVYCNEPGDGGVSDRVLPLVVEFEEPLS